MSKSLIGTETEKNLLKAFAGESQAKNRYEFFAKQARKEGYHQIANIFLETAMHEQAHAKRFFKFLEGGMVEITATYPAGIIGSTLENLKAAAEGENEEWTSIYPGFAEIAKQESLPEVAAAFKMIARVEEEHEKRYLKFLKNISEDKVFMRDGKVTWMCINCGYIYEAAQALEICPACQHPLEYMQIQLENY